MTEPQGWFIVIEVGIVAFCYALNLFNGRGRNP